MGGDWLDRRQRDEFAVRGIVHLPGFVDPDTAARIADGVWQVLARRGIDRHDPTTWPTGRVTKLQAVARTGVYQPFDDALRSVADQILGPRRWDPPNPPGPPLVSFPEPGPWVLPDKIWHFDLPARGAVSPPVALRLIGLIEPVARHGGGTLVVEGSHALVERMVAATSDGDAGRSADVRRRLAGEHSWFQELFTAGGDRDRFFEPEDVDGVTVRVTELTGDGGDAYLMHPWTLHGISQNTTTRVRSMVTHTVYGDGSR